jgi:hypothetical protein
MGCRRLQSILLLWDRPAQRSGQCTLAAARCSPQGPEDRRQLALRACFASSVHLAWSTTTADSLLCLLPELQDLATLLHATRGEHFLTLQVGRALALAGASTYGAQAGAGAGAGGAAACRRCH